MNDLKIDRLGPTGLLIEFAPRIDPASLALCRGLLQALQENPPSGLREVTAAYQTILLEFEATPDLAEVRGILTTARPLPVEAAALHEIPVVYDGPDLAALAARNKLSISEVIARHSDPTYDVYLVGFSPGFPYLGPLDEKLHAPRLATPRPRVPAGSVGIGGEHTGIYSIASPGGWWLIGRTDTVLFSEEAARGPGREEAFLLLQGDRVKFIPTAP